MNHVNTHSLDVERGILLVRNNLEDMGFAPRDSDGNDYQRGKDTYLRFKIGTAYMEITALVIVDNKQVEAVRATSWASLDRLLLSLRRHVDQIPPKTTITGGGR